MIRSWSDQCYQCQHIPKKAGLFIQVGFMCILSIWSCVNIFYIFQMYLSHPTLMVTVYHITPCLCLTVATPVSNECFCTKAAAHWAAEWAPAWLRGVLLSPSPLQFMAVSPLLRCGQAALTLCLLSGQRRMVRGSFPQLNSQETFLQTWSKRAVTWYKHWALLGRQGKPWSHMTRCSRVLKPCATAVYVHISNVQQSFISWDIFLYIPSVAVAHLLSFLHEFSAFQFKLFW